MALTRKQIAWTFFGCIILYVLFKKKLQLPSTYYVWTNRAAGLNAMTSVARTEGGSSMTIENTDPNMLLQHLGDLITKQMLKGDALAKLKFEKYPNTNLLKSPGQLEIESAQVATETDMNRSIWAKMSVERNVREATQTKGLMQRSLF
jgi:hypothetical protein